MRSAVCLQNPGSVTVCLEHPHRKGAHAVRGLEGFMCVSLVSSALTVLGVCGKGYSYHRATSLHMSSGWGLCLSSRTLPLRVL